MIDMNHFRTNCWKRAPYAFTESMIDIETDALSLDWAQDLLQEIPDDDLVYRTASGGISERMERLPVSCELKSSLVNTLRCATRSLMIHRADHYDRRLKGIIDRYVENIASGLNVPSSALKDRSASVFLSSPNAISPFHTDREQNFLVHLQGNKTVHVLPRWRSPAGELFEAFLRRRKGIHEEFRQAFTDRASTFELDPGSTLYLPRLFAHWVENGDTVSQSLSINFFCSSGYLIERFYKLNDKVRSWFV